GDGAGRLHPLGPVPVAVGLIDLGLHLPQVGLGPLDVGLGDGDLGLGLFEPAVGLGEHGLGAVDLRLVERLVDVGRHGALFYQPAVVDLLAAVARVLAEVDDQPGDLGADVDDLLRLDGAGGVDGGRQVAALDLGRAEPGGAGVCADVVPAAHA